MFNSTDYEISTADIETKKIAGKVKFFLAFKPADVV